MDYEQKYKNALKWMQSLYDGLHGATKEDAEHYFPELKETEDERMKKAIIAYISQDQHFGVSNTDILAWLEKQGEQKHIDYNEELKKCRENPLYFFVKYVSIKLKEQLPTWCKEDEKIRKEIIDFLELPHPQFVGKRDHEKWITWLEKQGHG